MKELLKNISAKDLEKLRMLLSIIPGNEPKEIVTLRVFIDEYSNSIKQNRSRAYHISVMSSFKHFIDFFGQQKSIHEIGLKEVESFNSFLQQKVRKGFRVYWRTLKAAFNKAVEWGYVNENYFKKVKLPKKQQLNPVFINSDQLSSISNQVKNEVVKEIIVFAFYTGMRLNEIMNLKWKNVDLKNRVITVGDESFTTKGRNQRFIPISDEVLTTILSQRERRKIIPINNSYLFCKDNGKRFTGDYISKRFKMACKTASMDNSIHFHSLRHSFASNLVQKGVPLYTIKELLGHSSISTTEVYSHLNMDSLRDAIKKMDTPNQPTPLIPLPRGENEVKIFRINSGEMK